MAVAFERHIEGIAVVIVKYEVAEGGEGDADGGVDVDGRLLESAAS